jgi:hypothetical protein
MAAKKIVKKPAKAMKMPAFNKANAKLFADNIFSDKQGRVSFLKLCDGNLSNGKDGGRTLHCALGEAYFTFVDSNVAKFVKDIEKKFGESTDDYLEEEERFNSKYSIPISGINHIPTLAVVDTLVDVAQLKSNSIKAKKNLAQALLNIMESNDDSCGADLADNLQRSKDVADMWLEQVIPLLK